MGFGGVGPRQVKSIHIAEDTIIAADIAPGAIGTSELAGSAVTRPKMASEQDISLFTLGTIPTASARFGSFTAARVTYGTFGNAKIGGDKITYGTISAQRLASSGNVKSGNYTGDGTNNRTIAHSLGAVPKLVMVQRNNDLTTGIMIRGDIWWFETPGGASGVQAVTAWDATNFYVHSNGTNDAGVLFYWTAVT